MSSYAYYNGKFGKKKDISIPLSDRSIYFGDAIYDAAIGSYDRILWENEHIDRFLANAEKIGIKHSFSKEYLSSLLREVAIKSRLRSYFLYFQISRSLPDRRHSASGASAKLLITVDPIFIEPNPAPLKLITVSDKRFGYCNVKTTNLLPSVLASTKAEKNGCDEAVFVKGRYVTECAKSNISIIKQGRVITHPRNNKILPGIAREHLLLNCRNFCIPYEERPFSVNEMLSADEILVTSTTKLCRITDTINRKKVGGKNTDLARNLCEAMYSDYKDFCQI